MRVYISGPMTGIQNFNFPAFNAAASKLRAMGYEVVNPVDINGDHSVPWTDCLRKDLKEMLNCDLLALLPGWQNSKGAHLEMHVAHRVGIGIVMVDDLDPLERAAPVMHHEGPDHGEHLEEVATC